MNTLVGAVENPFPGSSACLIPLNLCKSAILDQKVYSTDMPTVLLPAELTGGVEDEFLGHRKLVAWSLTSTGKTAYYSRHEREVVDGKIKAMARCYKRVALVSRNAHVGADVDGPDVVHVHNILCFVAYYYNTLTQDP